MVKTVIYLEGAARGPDSKELQVRCREGFRKLLESRGFKGRMPRLFASGGRTAVFGDFKIAHGSTKAGEYVAMWIDSEDPLADIEAAWDHLKVRDGWKKPAKAMDEQVLFMTTCMETWIVADRITLAKHFGSNLQESALPPLVDLETRSRQDVQDKLAHASRKCSNSYKKGKRSFEVLAKLDPTTLSAHLPSFMRAHQILNEKL